MRLEQIDHVAIWVRDVERSIRWYGEVLGLERRYEQWGTYPAMICSGSTCVALFEARDPSAVPAHHAETSGMRHLAFRVDRENFERSQIELRDHGIEWVFQDHEIAHSIYFRDLDGYELEITTYDLP